MPRKKPENQIAPVDWSAEMDAALVARYNEETRADLQPHRPDGVTIIPSCPWPTGGLELADSGTWSESTGLQLERDRLALADQLERDRQRRAGDHVAEGAGWNFGAWENGEDL